MAGFFLNLLTWAKSGSLKQRPDQPFLIPLGTPSLCTSLTSSRPYQDVFTPNLWKLSPKGDIWIIPLPLQLRDYHRQGAERLKARGSWCQWQNTDFQTWQCHYTHKLTAAETPGTRIHKIKPSKSQHAWGREVLRKSHLIWRAIDVFWEREWQFLLGMWPVRDYPWLSRWSPWKFGWEWPP